MGVSKENKYLIFLLGENKYGIPLNVVKEVIGFKKTTPVPRMPEFFLGIINLRGSIYPVIDLKAKLRGGCCETDFNKCVIIVELGELILGCTVDDVVLVNHLNTSQFDQGVDIEDASLKKGISGVARVEDDELILLIDLHALFTENKEVLMSASAEDLKAA